MGYLASSLDHLLTLLAGASIAIFSEPIKKRLYRPNLKITFDRGDHCNVRMAGGLTIVRLKVTNTSKFTAVNCKPFIHNLKAVSRANHSETEMTESRPLKWGFDDTPIGEFQTKSLDLYSNMSAYIDIAGFGGDKILSFNANLPSKISLTQKDADEFICDVIVACADGVQASTSFRLVRSHPESDFIFEDRH